MNNVIISDDVNKKNQRSLCLMLMNEFTNNNNDNVIKKTAKNAKCCHFIN